VTESEFLKAIAKLCVEYSILAHHCGDPKRCVGKGWPDLCLVGSHHIAFAELKQGSFDSLKPEQNTWRYSIIACGIRFYIWYPNMLTEIALDLEGLNQP
jgi:hypothetical protein